MDQAGARPRPRSHEGADSVAFLYRWSGGRPTRPEPLYNSRRDCRGNQASDRHPSVEVHRLQIYWESGNDIQACDEVSDSSRDTGGPPVPLRRCLRRRSHINRRVQFLLERQAVSGLGAQGPKGPQGEARFEEARQPAPRSWEGRRCRSRCCAPCSATARAKDIGTCGS